MKVKLLVISRWFLFDRFETLFSNDFDAVSHALSWRTSAATARKRPSDGIKSDSELLQSYFP